MKDASRTRSLVVLVALAGCGGRNVDLGGDVTPSAQSVADEGGSPAVGGANGANPACPSSAFDDGTGYLADLPAWCTDAAGAPQTFGATTDVAAALVGLWIGCTSAVLVNQIVQGDAGGLAGIEFTSDGRFLLWDWDDRNDLAFQQSAGSADAGTFTVVDASAALGPGTFQVRLSASTGGVFISQVVVFGSPPRVRFFAPSADDYVHPLTASYRANVCGPAFGALRVPSSNDDLSAALQGKWARCQPIGNRLLTALYDEGLEFPGDGTYYELTEDPSGQLVRSTDPLQFGTLVPDARAAFSFDFQPHGVGGGTSILQPVLDECGGLAFTGTVGNGFDGDPYGGALQTNTYITDLYRRLP